ncbi:MAG TPA: hypothetical protein V6D07_19195 [Trichocoleus sp.]
MLSNSSPILVGGDSLSDLGILPTGSAKPTGSFSLMDYIEKALEKLREWIDRVIDTLLGPEVQPEHEPIPIPVDDRNYHR